jgi:hypothetical protein
VRSTVQNPKHLDEMKQAAKAAAKPDAAAQIAREVVRLATGGKSEKGGESAEDVVARLAAA